MSNQDYLHMPSLDVDFKGYEAAVKSALDRFVREQLPQAQVDVYGSRLYKGKSGLKHQIDVSVDGIFGGIRLFIIGECKCYKRKVGKRDVTSFCSIKNDLEPDFSFMFTTEGYDRGAKEFADANNISLIIQPKYNHLGKWEIIVPAAAILTTLSKKAPALGISESSTAELLKKDGQREPSCKISSSRPVAADQPLWTPVRDVDEIARQLLSADPEHRLKAIDSLVAVLSRVLIDWCNTIDRQNSPLSEDISLPELLRATIRVSRAVAISRSAINHSDLQTRLKAITSIGVALADVNLSRSISALRTHSFLEIHMLNSVNMSKLKWDAKYILEFLIMQDLRAVIVDVIGAFIESEPLLKKASAGAISDIYLSLREDRSSLLFLADIRAHLSDYSILPSRLEQRLMSGVALSLKSSDIAISSAAVLILSPLADTQIVELLLPRLQLEEEIHRAIIIRTLGHLNYENKDSMRDVKRMEKAAAAVSEHLLNGDLELRRESVVAIRIGRFRIARESLVEALNDKDDEVCRNAALALAEMGDSRAVNVLLTILETDRDMEALNALVALRCERAISILIKRIKASNSEVDRSRYFGAINAINPLEAAKLLRIDPSLIGIRTASLSQPAGSGFLSRIAAGLAGTSAFFGLSPNYQAVKRVSRRVLFSPWKWFRQM